VKTQPLYNVCLDQQEVFSFTLSSNALDLQHSQNEMAKITLVVVFKRNSDIKHVTKNTKNNEAIANNITYNIDC